MPIVTLEITEEQMKQEIENAGFRVRIYDQDVYPVAVWGAFASGRYWSLASAYENLKRQGKI